MKNISLASTKSKPACVPSIGTGRSEYTIELIQRFKAGETEAKGFLFNLYQDKVYKLAYKYTEKHEDASDISQEVFLRALVGLKEFKWESTFYTWLYRITMNLCSLRSPTTSSYGIDFHRRKWYDKTTSLDALSSIRREFCSENQPAQDKLVLDQELHRRLCKAIIKLPPMQQTAFVLHYLNGLITRKIAVLIGCSEGTVKANLFHARQKLRAILQPYMETYG